MNGPAEQAQLKPGGVRGVGALGTFAGVFTPSILTILGIILFLRLGYVVGNSGLVRALEIILVANLISVLTTFSVSAIATNFKVKGGGDYYLISRTLGLGYGGAIGIVLFLAQSVSIGFYCVGFGEAVAALIPGGGHLLAQILAAAAVLMLFRLAWLGADLATRFQFVVMAMLVAALMSFAAGAFFHWDGTMLAQNLGTPEYAMPFWVAFAIFFPAVTGFTQGVSMSGDLRDPGASIPLGTFLAVGLSIAIYVGVAFLFAANVPLDVLARDYGAMRGISAVSWLIDLGVVAATLSSALASFLGAPRILQSLASDRIFTALRPFAHGVGPNLNPRRAVVLSGIVALVVVALGNLNAIAPVVSMFFLVSYGLVNYATYFEATAASPSFRPTFRWYHRYASLAGTFACIAVGLAIDAFAALAAICILFAIFQYLKIKGIQARWADSRRSFQLKQVRDNLLAASRETEHPRDWRPNILAFSDSPSRRARLVRFASWVEGGSGITTVVRVLEGEGQEMIARREETLEALTKELREAKAAVFPLVVTAPSFESALPLLVQAVGTGPIRVNTVLANWFEGPPGLVSQWASDRYGRRVRMAFRLGANLLILDATEQEWEKFEAAPPRNRVIDVWWRSDQTGEMMVLLAYQMTRSDEWRGATIRVLVAANGGDSMASLGGVGEMLEAARIDAQTVVVENPGSAAFVAQSASSSIVFFGFEIQGGRIIDSFGDDVANILSQLPLVVMSMAAQDVDLDAQPDEGGPAESAAMKDRIEDATRAFEKARGEAADAARGAEPAALSKLEDDAQRTAQTRMRETAAALDAAQANLQTAQHDAHEAGLDPEASSGKKR